MRRYLAALLTVAGLLTAAVVAAPAAHASTTPISWSVNYGAAITNNSPNVWSNRNPTWTVGGDPSLTMQPNGNLMVQGSLCPAANAHVCWSTHTANVGPGPWQAWWDSRYNGPTGTFRIYSSEGVVRFDTHTSGWTTVKMAFFINGCLNIYGGDYGSWGVPIWSNSSSSACYISLG